MEIYYGTIGLLDLEARIKICQRAGLRMVLPRTNIVIPDSYEEDSLRTRRDELCQVKDSRGQEMLQDTWWIKENGQQFVWSDKYG